MTMHFCIDPDQLRKALADAEKIKEAIKTLEEANEFLGDEIECLHTHLRITGSIKDLNAILSTQPEVQAEDAKDATGLTLIAAERQRQISKEGWTPDHDDEHDAGELAMAAALYATPEPLYRICENQKSVTWVDPWPWHNDVEGGRGGWTKENAWDKRHTHTKLRRLVIAGALIAAEIDRLNRAAIQAQGAKQP